MRTCQYCGRPNLTNADEVCNGCGGNLPAESDVWRKGFIDSDKKYEELTFDPYKINHAVRIVTDSSTSDCSLIWREGKANSVFDGTDWIDFSV